MMFFQKWMDRVYHSILFFTDPHCPYSHPDWLVFLKAVTDKYKPDLVVCGGDEVDNHSISFHPKNPDLPGANEEFDSAIKALSPLYKMYPNLKLLESNHGSLVYRKGIDAGLPRRVFKSYNDILEAPKGWSWHFDLKINTPNGLVYMHHGKTSAIEKLSKSMACNCIQGHYHSKFYVSYWASPQGLFFDANAGSLSDWHSLAMAYAKNNVPKPILGCIVILEGRAKLVPMRLNNDGRWDRQIKG